MSDSTGITRTTEERLDMLKDSIVLSAINGEASPAPPALVAYLATLTQIQRNWVKSFISSNETEGVGRLSYADLQANLEVHATCRSFLATLAQRGGSGGPTGEVVSAMIPKMAPFNGKVDKGYTFIETFKIQANGLSEIQQIKTFGALCGPQAGH
jgi:hypothetical protein